MLEKRLYNLTEAQKRIWYTQMIYPKSSMFVIGGPVIVHGKLDVNVLKRSICEFVNLHDSFQIRLTSVNGQPFQYFSNIQYNLFHVEIKDFSTEKEPQKAFEAWVEEKAREPFLMEDNKLFEFPVFKLDENIFGYLVRIHHLIVDGWSIQILTKEISFQYTNIISGKKSLEKLEEGLYKDFISKEQEYIASERYQKNKKFWIDMFTPLPAKSHELFESINGARKSYFLSEESIQYKKKLCERYKITPNSLFVAVYLLYLYKVEGEEDIVIGNPVLGRYQKKDKQIIGMFVNNMSLRYIVKGDETIAEAIKSVDMQLKRCFINQRYPYNHLVKELKAGHSHLYNSCINYYNTSMCNQFHGFSVNNTEFYNGQQEYDFQMIIREWSENEEIQIDFDYKIDLYTIQECDERFRQIETLIKIICFDSEKRIADICLLTENEKIDILEKYNNTDTRKLEGTTVVDLFRIQSKMNPYATAVIDKDTYVTYKNLDEETDQLAVFLQNRGVGKECAVGILTNYSIETLICIFGVLKAGAAYIPIDVTCPIDRMSYMLEEAGAEVLLTNLDNIEKIKFTGSIFYINDKELYRNNPEVKIDAKINGSSAAYIIYTSGSSGKPKGVIIEHRSLLNYICWAKQYYNVSNSDTFPLYSSLMFDLTVTSIYLPLISGGKVIIYEDVYDEYILYRILRENNCTIIKLTPAHLMIMKALDNSNSTIEKIIVGGENLTEELAKIIYKSFHGKVSIYNEYGPTEATVGCMIYKYNPLEIYNGSVPIGRPINNMKAYILDKHGIPLPIGVQGELYVSGEGIAREYLNEPEQTKEKFVAVDFFDGRLLYRTGDVGKFINNDCIEYIGRIDQQIKINGYRIELSEIEQSMQNYQDILQVVVISVEIRKGYCLCAYFTAKEKVSTLDITKYLESRIMPYMIPKLFVQLDEMPLNKNGKIDRKALLNKNIKINNSENSIPSNVHEIILVNAMSKIFGFEVTITDNYYQLGGDSIKAIQIASVLNEIGYRLQPKEILSNPIIQEMVFYMKRVGTKSFGKVKSEGLVPLTPAIEWFLEKMKGKRLYNPNSYCLDICLKLKDTFQIDELEDIIEKMIIHHDTLRINYNQNTGELYFNNKSFRSKVECLNYESDSYLENNNKNKQKEVYDKVISSMNIMKDPLIKSCLIRFLDVNIWVIAIHHLACDGVSMRIFLDDLDTLLKQKQNKKELQILDHYTSFKNWGDEILNLKKTKEDINYWNNILKKITEIHWGTRHIKQNKNLILLNRKFDREVSDMLTVANIPYKTKTEELLAAALIKTLQTINNKNEVLLELEGHGRSHNLKDRDVSKTMGWFTCMYPVLFCEKCDNLNTLIKLVKETVRNASVRDTSYALCSRTKEKWKFEEHAVRFNYLGDFSIKYDNFSIMLLDNIRSRQKLHSDYLFEIDFFLNEQKQLVFSMNFLGGYFSKEITHEIADQCYQNVIEIVEYCSKKNEIIFTPCDFETVDLSQEDIETLII